MTVHTEIVRNEHVGERIDKVMATYDASISRSKAQQLLKEGVALINDKRVKPNYRCQSGDVLSWFIPEAPERIIKAEAIPLDIVYEDDSLLIVNKEQGMIVHPTDDQLSGTLVNALLYHTHVLAKMGTERPGIVHRIDKDTSGLLIVAKTGDVFDQLSHAFKCRSVVRVYEALVHGEIEHEQGVIEAPIGRDPNQRLRMAVQDTGRYAKTYFTVLSSRNGYTYVSCQLETGRTHQIRVHMEYIGHPIVNDPVYGKNRNKQRKGQMLFAKHLAFEHPVTKQHMEFTIDPPDFFKEQQGKLGLD